MIRKTLYLILIQFNEFLLVKIPYPFRFAADKPEGGSKDGEKQGFIGMVPKVFEVLGIDINEQKRYAKLAGDNIL